MNNSLDLHIKKREFYSRPMLTKHHSRTNSGSSAAVLNSISRLNINVQNNGLPSRHRRNITPVDGASLDMTKEEVNKKMDTGVYYKANNNQLSFRQRNGIKDANESGVGGFGGLKNGFYYHGAGLMIDKIASGVLKPVMSLRGGITMREKLGEADSILGRSKEASKDGRLKANTNETTLMRTMNKIKIICKKENDMEGRKDVERNILKQIVRKRGRKELNQPGQDSNSQFNDDKFLQGVNQGMKDNSKKLIEAIEKKRRINLNLKPSEGVLKIPCSLKKKITDKKVQQVRVIDIKSPIHNSPADKNLASIVESGGSSLIKIKKRTRSASYTGRSPISDIKSSSREENLDVYKKWLLSDNLTKIIYGILSSKSKQNPLIKTTHNH